MEDYFERKRFAGKLEELSSESELQALASLGLRQLPTFKVILW